MHQQSNANRAGGNDELHAIERVRLTWRLIRDPRIATWMKAVLPIVAGLYLILPIDLIPDVILGLGQIDDVSMIGVAVFAMTKLLPKLAPDAIVHEHVSAMRGRRERGDVVDAAFTVVDHPSAAQRDRAHNTNWEKQA